MSSRVDLRPLPDFTVEPSPSQRNARVSSSYGEHRWLRHLPVYFPFDDSGRSQSRRPKQLHTVRALAIAYQIPFDEAYDVLATAAVVAPRAWFPTGQRSSHACSGRLFLLSRGRAGGTRRNSATSSGRVAGLLVLAKIRVRRHRRSGSQRSPTNPGRCIYGCWKFSAV